MPKTLDEKVFHAVEKLLEQNPNAVMKAVLEGSYWPDLLKPMEMYTRLGDDNGGEISVVYGPDGDGYIEVISRLDPNERSTMHRFRMPILGGGESERVHKALLFLALAIKLDNEAHPQHHRKIVEYTDE